LPAVPPELRIVEAVDAATVAAFEGVFIDGYPIPALQPVRAGSLYDARVVGGRLRLWVGYLGDQPMATAVALVDGAVNGIFSVVTLPEARGRGYGTALTAHAIASCPSLPAVLGASALGYGLYTRLGFTEVAHCELWLRPR
jgi:GNAT superfamily N-acetyltransferase